MAVSKSKFYTVWVGRVPGIYATWEECKAQTMGFEGAKYKSFPTEAEAIRAFSNKPETYFKKTNQNSAVSKQTNSKQQSKHSAPIVPSISVDAACSGNPGIMEYRGVNTESGVLIFYQGPFEGGTNNIGEFLALVHALALLKKQNKFIPVYTDSLTARTWVKNKKVKTTLDRNHKTETLFKLIDRAINWLENNEYTTEILVWDTPNWGEIPADFGRK